MDIWIHEDMNISRLGAESRTVAALSVLWRVGGYCMAAGGAGVLLFGVLEQFSRESYGYNVTQGIVAVGQIIVGPASSGVGVVGPVHSVGCVSGDCVH